MSTIRFQFTFDRPLPAGLVVKFSCDPDGPKGPKPRAEHPMVPNTDGSYLEALVPTNQISGGAQFFLTWRGGPAKANFRLVAIHDWPVIKVVFDGGNFANATSGWIAGTCS